MDLAPARWTASIPLALGGVKHLNRPNAILRLIDVAETVVWDAAIDGRWQLLTLPGDKQLVPMAVDRLSYEVPSSFGMRVASYAVNQTPASAASSGV